MGVGAENRVTTENDWGMVHHWKDKRPQDLISVISIYTCFL